MAEESEKRFQEAMDRLFRSPPKSTTSRVQLSRGQKRPLDMSSALTLVGPDSRIKAVDKQNSLPSNTSGVAPPCRPWDRNDLFRRIATFKSMTWFAKPQAMSAVNCARRGWINVDMDTIACEACGSRILFATPPSWTQQQVDKAALVFSLKLDSGHKLLCPWIDNVCDEKLADFTPTANAVLVDQYKTRHSVLSELAAFPLISPKAIDCLRSPQLEQFLCESLNVKHQESMEEAPREEDNGNDLTSVSPLTYYQAQKLTSLCGWELRRLPYLVDSKDQLDQSSKDENLSKESLLSGKNHTITVYNTRDKSSEEKPDDDSQVSEEVFNPNSAVLECRLCGACIGLWAFSMVARPVEFLRVSGYTEVNEDHVSNTACGKNLHSGYTDHDATIESRVHDAASGNTMLDRTPPNSNFTISGGPPPASQNFRAKISLPIVGRNLRAWFIAESELRDGLVTKSSSGACKNSELIVGGNAEDGTSSSKLEIIKEPQLGNDLVAEQVSGNTSEMAGNAKSMDKVDPLVKDHCNSNVGNDFGSNGKDSDTSPVGESVENSRVMVEGNNFTQAGEQGNGNDVIMAGVRPLSHNMATSLGKDLQNLPLDKAMEFDPFKLHRHFCPWVVSSGGSPPGWEQTLSALEHHEEYSSPLSSYAPSTIEVDDPVASVQKLFTSPPAKRKKLVRPS